MKEFEDSSLKEVNHRKKSVLSVLGGVIIVFSLIFFGAVGGIGGIMLLSAKDNALAKKLGIDLEKITIPTTKTEKIVVEESSAIIDSTNKVSDSVVSIVLKSQATNIFGQTYETSGAGTGFIITSDGLILTNKHVASDTSAEYTVVTNDGKTYDAKVQSQDPFNDLAVLKIDARNLPAVELGDSDQLQVGQWVVAVGNALGRFQNTVTAGVISAKNRSIEATDSSGNDSESLTNLLQTDAAINPGNSGGPLVNLAGQVIGINTAVASSAQGIGFAIPINDAKNAIDSIKSSGRIIRPYLGVRYVELSKAISDRYNLPVSEGAWVRGGNSIFEVAVIPGSPAGKAGIVENDIIVEINGEKITENKSLVSIIQDHKVGDEVTVKLSSKGSEKTVKVKLEESK